MQNCICDCGNTVIVKRNSLISGHTKSCGCVISVAEEQIKSILDQHNITYDEDYRQTQDLRLWEMLAPLGEFANLRDKLVLYRISDQQITKASGKGQINNALKIRHRLQKAWLDQLGFTYSESDLEKRSSEILTHLRNRKDINKSLEYKAFLHYVYFYSSDNSHCFSVFSNGDWRYLSFMDLLRVLGRSITK